ncbi:MAG: choice-of-anchor Q domain-containing protein [Myxococcota bacterium]
MRLFSSLSLAFGVIVTGCGDGSSMNGGAGGSNGTVWPCSEQGIRDAIDEGGGPHFFDCDGPTTVATEAVLEINNQVWLDGEGNLTIDANRAHRVFELLPMADVSLIGMTITGGDAEALGGGIFSQGKLFLEDCEIVENTSGDIGGGIHSLFELLVFNSVISRNEASQGGGAAFSGRAEIDGATFANNVGGAIYNSNQLFLRNAQLVDNTTEFGGGAIVNIGDAFVSNAIITNNRAQSGGGISNAGYLFLGESTVEGNVADEGGGVYGFDATRNLDGGDLQIFSLGWIDSSYTTIANNRAVNGGGIYSVSIRMTMFDSTVSGNSADEAGGALYVDGTTLGASTTYLNANTIVDNTAPSGAAIFSTGETPTLRLAANIIDGDCAVQPSAVIDSEGSNLESPGDTCGLNAATDRVDVTPGELNLGPLADNGGETETHLPMPGSIAIDAIALEDCDVVLPIVPLLDQRLVMRPQGAGCDIGSVEVEDQ